MITYGKISCLSVIGLCASLFPECDGQALTGKQIRQPDILLIFTDQQNIRAMSAAGNPDLHTPAMDRLATDGVRFTDVYCASPVSGPSRATLVTGMMPHANGVEWNDNSHLAPQVKTIGHILQAAGYRTVWAGKWHIPEIYPQRSADRPFFKYGFEFLPFWDAPDREWLLGSRTDPPLTDAVVRFLDEYPGDKPLFMAVSYHNPHDICMFPRKEGWETDRDTLLRVMPFGEYRLPFPVGVHPDSVGELPPLPSNFGISVPEPEFVRDKRTKVNPYGDEVRLAAAYSDKEWRAYLNAYYRLTERVDAEIGRVIETLKRTGRYENTLIIFTSDHGDGMGAHRWAAKLNFHQESVQVPLIIVPPGKKVRGKVQDIAPVSLIDILPTCCDYAGLEIPTQATGISLRDMIEGNRKPQRRFVVCELADHMQDRNRKGRMICSRNYKYCVYASGKGREQLFDLINDPGEMVNLADDPAYTRLLKRYRRYLDRWMKENNDKLKIVP